MLVWLKWLPQYFKWKDCRGFPLACTLIPPWMQLLLWGLPWLFSLTTTQKGGGCYRYLFLLVLIKNAYVANMLAPTLPWVFVPCGNNTSIKKSRFVNGKHLKSPIEAIVMVKFGIRILNWHPKKGYCCWHHVFGFQFIYLCVLNSFSMHLIGLFCVSCGYEERTIGFGQSQAISCLKRGRCYD